MAMKVFKNVVAQFIGQMRLMNQATTEILEVKLWNTGKFSMRRRMA